MKFRAIPHAPSYALNTWIKKSDDADYLDTSHSKRNTAEYDLTGRISTEEAHELVDFTKELQIEVIDCLKNKHSSNSVRNT